MTYSSGLPTESIITSPDKYTVFPSFSVTENFLVSSVPSPPPDKFSLASLEAGFDTCGKKGGGEEEERMIWDVVIGVFNLTSYSGIPNESIILSPDKSAVLPSFSDTTTFIASSIPSPLPDTFSMDSLADGFDTCVKKGGYEE